MMRVAGQPTPEQRIAFFSELKYGMQTVADNYDVILVDSPPALGMISVNVLMAADALLVPSAARMFDFSSTVQFFRMVHNYIGQLDPEKSYRWISVLTTLFDRRYESQKQFFEVMRACFGDSVFQRVFLSFQRRDQFGRAVHYPVRAGQARPPGAGNDGCGVRRDRAGDSAGMAVQGHGAEPARRDLKG